MPVLKDVVGLDLSNYKAVAAGTNPLAAENQTSLLPGASGFTRCPLPILSSASDGLRTFYLGNRSPQNRVYSQG